MSEILCNFYKVFTKESNFDTPYKESRETKMRGNQSKQRSAENAKELR